MNDEGTYKPQSYTFEDEIVISGIAGRFPDSDNMNQLRENLFSEINLVRADHDRWKIEHLDLPTHMGTVNNVNKFDADFFGISSQQAHVFSPEIRMLLEHSHEAIIDAGINPKQLRGKNTAVIMGTCVLEAEEKLLYEDLQVGGLNIIGCSKSAIANMISHYLDLKGPSYTVDTACSTAFYTVALGYHCIRSGICEDAIVGAANLCFHPFINIQHALLGILSPNGCCRPFDVAANGYTRSETVAVIYLQKAKNAKRIYAICSHAKMNNDGYKAEGITFPSTTMQSILLEEFYNECKIPTSYLDYFEAHGTSTKVGDPAEINAIYNVICKNRKSPLMIGSVKSNLGHSEAASGFTQIAKIIIAFETGFISPNIHYTSPRNDINALHNGSVEIITEPMPVKNGYVAANCFGFGGANAHILFKWNIKSKINTAAPDDDLPRLVTLSGRTEESVKLFLTDVANHPIDVEYIRLLHDIHADNIDGHSWRGYTILTPSQLLTKSHFHHIANELNTLQQNSIKVIQKFKNVKRPVWFIFSSLGTQWPGMGRSLLKFHVFANAIRICDATLKPYDISITDILTRKDEKMRENYALHAFVGIVAVQIGLVDLLTSLGIVADYMIGHSAGELGCAYADKCLTIEQTIVSAYFIATACTDRKIIRSSAAVIRLDYEKLKNICPTDIEIICRNNRYNNIVSGPVKSIQKFITKLQNDNISVKEIYCNVPYHSCYISSVKTQLLLKLNEIIPEPKERSLKWISTSVHHTKWSILTSKLSSAEYHTNSIINTILFEQTIHLIQNNAVTIEIAPDSVLQNILNQSLHSEVTNIILTQRTNEIHERDTDVVLQGIGKLYNCGLQPQIANLYPPVNFPVRRGTPMISPSIRWDHSEDWFVPTYNAQKRNMKSGERCVEIALKDENYDYMAGYVIDGRNLLPPTGYLALVWQTVGMMKGQIYTTLPIIFQDVSFIRAIHLTKDNVIKLTIAICKDGKFEITEEDSTVVTGTVYETANPEQDMISTDLLPDDNDEEEHMTEQDVYKLQKFKLRDYQYSGWFRGLKTASISGNKGHIVWTGNWVTFMDNMLQMQILGYNTSELYITTSIQKLIINPLLHKKKLQEITEEEKQMPIRVYKEIDTIIAGGIEIRGFKTTQISGRKIAQSPVLQEHVFVAHHDYAKMSLDKVIRICAQLVLDDHRIVKVNAIEIVEDIDNVAVEDLSSSMLVDAFGDIPLVQVDISLLTSPNRFNPVNLPPHISIGNLTKSSIEDKVIIICGFNLLSKQQILEERVLPFLKEGGFILTRENCNLTVSDKYLQQYQLNVILEKRTDKETIILLKNKMCIEETTVVYINNHNFNWLENLKLLLSDKNENERNSRIIIVGEKDFDCGVLGFVNCLRKEPGGTRVRGVFIQDKEAPKFSLQNSFYVQQLQKDMSINVLRPNKMWGSYRHLRLPQSTTEFVPSAHLCQTVRGDLSSFCWVENDRTINFRREDLVHVVYSSLNFKDVMLTTGKLQKLNSQGRFTHTPLGMEYVGFDADGQRVMGLCDTDSIANIVAKDKTFCWKIPDTWTFEEAATIPCVYSTAYFALYIRGKIKRGNKILIHSGTGAVGQAAIHLALQEECVVFTTVGTCDKRDFIKKLFPTIRDEHIGNSRDTSFEQMVMRQTHGRGVDIVLNSLAEEKLIASVRCLAQNGRFLQIDKVDMISNNPLDMSIFQKGISFYGILLDNMLNGNHIYKTLLSNMMADGLKNGAIKPIQAKVFLKSEIEAAFRYMASGKHMGKVIINMQERDKLLDEHVVAQRRYYCVQDKSYVILGGLGGFGLELTDWLICRGAKNVVLISRSGIKNGYQRMKIKFWKSYGVNVLIFKNVNVDVSEDCEHLLRTVERQAPVDAIFNVAMVLKDGLLKNQTAKTFAESFRPKAWATQMLDKLSRKICPKLRHFVVFSSVNCGRGNAEQTNYGMANSSMERICERRMQEGLPGLAIQWGSICDVGYVADVQKDNSKELFLGGTLQQKLSCCLEKLEKFLLQNCPVVSSMVLPTEKKAESSGFSSLVETVANILDIKDVKVVRQNAILADFGMDSLMAVEIRQTIEREFAIILTVEEIRHLTFTKLNEICGKSNLKETCALK
ncbi:hypothetical protein P5V15_012347 [Pogonomyrmex californicus]